jgi:hypothetical protein
MKSEEFDRAFGDGEMSRPSWTCRPLGGRAWSSGGVNVDFPEWMIESLDREARRLGVHRQSIIKIWIAERLERSTSTG